MKQPETIQEYIDIYNAISSAFAGDYYPEEDYIDRDDYDDDADYAIAVATKMQREPDFYEEFFGGAKEFFNMEDGFLESACLTEEEFRETWPQAAILEPYGFFD